VPSAQQRPDKWLRQLSRSERPARKAGFARGILPPRGNHDDIINP
jgi:hypothetical protein